MNGIPTELTPGPFPGWDDINNGPIGAVYLLPRTDQRPTGPAIQARIIGGKKAFQRYWVNVLEGGVAVSEWTWHLPDDAILIYGTPD